MRLDFSTIVPCMPYSGWNVFRSMTPSATYSGDWHGRGASAVRSLGRVADGAPATAQRGLHPGLGLHRVRALRGTGRSLARAQSPQARTAQSSPLAGRARRSPLPTPRLAPQRQLRVSPWPSRVSPRSPRAVGTAPDDPLGTG